MEENQLFSCDEIQLIENEQFIRKKNKILRQSELILQKLGNQTAEKYSKLNALSPPPKVSKGEKHQGLPFVVLDYPRYFSKTDIFAIRTMIWWSKAYSVSLILKGKYLTEYLKALNKNLVNSDGLFYTQIGDIWENELTNEVNSKTKISETAEFVKLSFQFPLSELNNLKINYLTSLEKLLNLINYEGY